MSWINRVWQEFHAGNLTRGFRDVCLTLHTYRGTGGVAWPSHASLAARARCCTKTVARALAAAAALGLVRWSERRVRAGWRWLRTSNLYRFIMPAGPVAVCPKPGHTAAARSPKFGHRDRRFVAKPTTGQTPGGSESKKFRREALAAFLAGATAGPDLLAQRRAMMEARWLGNGCRAGG